MKVIQVGKRRKNKNLTNKLLIIVVLFLFMSCVHTNKEVYVNPALLGMPLKQLLDSLGSPYSETNMTIKKGVNLYEYQSGLLSLYKLEKGDSVVVKEVMWKDSKENKCFWFENKNREWVMVDNLFWNKEVKF